MELMFSCEYFGLVQTFVILCESDIMFGSRFIDLLIKSNIQYCSIGHLCSTGVFFEVEMFTSTSQKMLFKSDYLIVPF
jgi:hypothetical protein